MRAPHVQQALPKLGKPRREGTHRTLSTQPNHCFFTKVVFGWGEIPQPQPDEFQPIRSEISATYAQGAARKCFRAKWRNTGWGCRCNRGEHLWSSVTRMRIPFSESVRQSGFGDAAVTCKGFSQGACPAPNKTICLSLFVN
ncbi:hypothetical protein AVEN_23391-1 [Araneus ventricosus]|uniref:Uncharacterized protein n=1 Tax=Araneus ventricosus TaxID=182803 RepID=A0A4Y2T8Y2_ARAVE|nr:hypothetical protein AVEN_23391-1 [Araneus ventricosus]